MINESSAIPAWLQSILPGWLTAHPAFTEAAYAFIYAIGLSTFTIAGVMWGMATSQNQAGDPAQFLAFVHQNLFGVVFGYVFGGGGAGLRAKQAHLKAKAAEVIPKADEAETPRGDAN